MRLVRNLIRAAGFTLLLTGAAAASMQSLTCADTADAMTLAAEVCTDLDTNTLCYGHPLVYADLIDTALTFETPGDRVPFGDVRSVTTYPYDPDTGEWGIAYLNAVDAAGSEIELLLYGAVTLVHESDGLQMEFSAETLCADAPGGIIARAPDGAEIMVNGETITLTETPVIFTMQDGELVTTPLVLTTGETDEGESDAPDSLFEAYESIPPAGGAYAIETFNPAAGVIIPTAGTWYLESYSAHLVAACDGEYIGADRRPPDSAEPAEFDFSGGVSVDSFVEQLMGSVPPAEFDNPAPNIYTGLGEISSGTIELTLYVMSETEMIYSIVHTQVRCRVQLLEWWMKES